MSYQLCNLKTKCDWLLFTYYKVHGCNAKHVCKETKIILNIFKVNYDIL